MWYASLLTTSCPFDTSDICTELMLVRPEKVKKEHEHKVENHTAPFTKAN